MTQDYDGLIKHAAQLIQDTNHRVAFSGAGISTPSGIPDFRSPQTGLWEQNDPMESASLTTFTRHPDRFYNWLRPLARDIWNANPNPAHLGLAALETRGLLQFTITQNIDSLHQRAGTQKIAELHGSLEIFNCLKCGRNYPVQMVMDDILNGENLPKCTYCQAVLKPDITLFEELLPTKAWDEAQKHSQNCDLMIVLGSSLSVYPAANLPALALQNHAHLILINQTPTALDQYADVCLPYDLAQVVPDICKLI